MFVFVENDVLVVKNYKVPLTPEYWDIRSSAPAKGIHIFHNLIEHHTHSSPILISVLDRIQLRAKS